MTDRHFSQREIICEGSFDTTGLISPGTVAVAHPSYWLKMWINGYGLFHYSRSKTVTYLLLLLFLYEHFFSTWFFMRRAIVYGVLPDLVWVVILFKTRQQHCHCWSSTTVYQSGFQCESKQAALADVSVQKIPWSWGCPEPSCRCPLRVGCHSSSVNHSPPCKHHQWSPPVEIKSELTICRHRKVHL